MTRLRVKMGMVLGTMLMLGSCAEKEMFTAIDPIMLKGIRPIGLVRAGNGFWLSDGDKNRVVQVNKDGEILSELNDLERPMHIDKVGENLFIPSYGLDVILEATGKYIIDSIGGELELEAPASVSIQDDKIAIADFYNHRIVFYNGQEWIFFGSEKGKEPGQFDYPTDVQILGDKIYVADAYNNRGQVLDMAGNSILVFGEDLEMNAATGLFVTNKVIALTDFENDRLIVFDHEGKVLQIMEGSLFKPTDVLIEDDVMYVTNYGGGYISRFNMN